MEVTQTPAILIQVYFGRRKEIEMMDDQVYEDEPDAIEIRLKNSEEKVVVYVDELPEDVNDDMDLLKGEIVSLDIWLRFAVRFLRNNNLFHSLYVNSG